MTSVPTRPVLRWHGSKWRIAPWVVSHFPPHRVYVEPFGGAAGVMLRKPRAMSEIYNDLDRDLVRMFRVIREQPESLALALELTPYARDEYRTLYESTDCDIEAARRFIARSFMGMSSKGAMARSGFDSRVNPDGFAGRLRSLLEVPEQVIAVAERFRHVIIENCDALQLVRRFSRDDALLYVDPPYLAEARSGRYYAHEMTDEQHAALLDALKASEAHVVLSGYPSALYDAALADWLRAESPAYTDGGHARTEVLWINPRAAALVADRRAYQQVELNLEAAE
jgi:DNA adenine methylase